MTNDRDLAFTSGLDLAARMREGILSPVEVTEAFLRRIESLDGDVNSYITVAGDQALAAAKKAEAMVGAEDLPPFFGVPVSIKDLIDTAGIRTTYATAAWSSRVPDRDAAVVTKLKQAGFIVIGKNNTPEFAGGIYTEPAAYGPCRNPWNLDYSPGGSSGGSGAAVAAGLAPTALGADDGGSIRIPSSWCGLFGIKPSRGRVSAAPDPAAPYYTPGPMSHTVADAAAMLDAISGYVTGDGFWAPPPDGRFLDEVGRDPGQLRIAFTTRGADGVDIATGNEAAVHTIAAALSGLGHTVEEVESWPGRGTFPDNRALPLHVIYGVKYATWVDLGLMPPEETLEPVAQELIKGGRQALAVDLMRAMHLEADLAREIVAFFDGSDGSQGYDVLLTPVIACQPSRVGEFKEHPENSLRLIDAVQFTAQFSQTGQPAVAIPAAVDDLGLPVGVQLVGRPADEATLIRVAAQLEQALPWADRHPVRF
jgi:amidase